MQQVRLQAVDKLCSYCVSQMVVTDQAWLFQQVWYSHDRILRQPCVVNVLKIPIQELCIGQPCNKSDILVKPVKSCQQVVPT